MSDWWAQDRTGRGSADGLLDAGSPDDVGWSKLPSRDDWLVTAPGLDGRPASAPRPPAHRRELRPVTRIGAWAALVVIAVVIPSVVDVILLNNLTRSLAIAVTLMGLQVLLGHGGLLSLGHGALLGLGAWAAGVATSDLGIDPILAVPVSAVALAVVGLGVGLPALRLSRIGLVLLTLAGAVSFPLLFQKFVGPLGKAYEPIVPPAWTGLDETDDDVWAYALAVVVTAVAYLGLRLALAGRFGRSLQAVRDEPQAAAAFGVPVARVRLAAFALSSALAGAGGALLLIQTPFVYGQDFPFQLSVQLFAIVLLIGSSRLAGALAGGLVLVLLPRVLSAVGLIGLEDLIYAGVLLAAIVAFRGRGVGPLVANRLVSGPLGRDRRPPAGATARG